MTPTDHVAIDKAIKAKQAQQHATASKPAHQASMASKIVTAGVWLAAAGSLVAVFLAN